MKPELPPNKNQIRTQQIKEMYRPISLMQKSTIKYAQAKFNNTLRW
jgi:hypothetical protein